MRLPVVTLQPAPAPVKWETGPRSIAAVRVLRISVTDRCNFRCVYCMPEEGVKWLARDDLLRFEEIVEIVRAAVEVHGIRRFKLTGGEPTVRHGIVDLVKLLRGIQGVEDLSLTTNGMLLAEMAQPLKDVGLDRVTVSIDSLRQDRFRRITRTGDLSTVLRGLDACAQAGLANLKINCVTMRGTNDDEFGEFARLTTQRDLTVRFIEYMPLGDSAIQHADPAVSKSTQCSEMRVAEEETGPAGGCGAQERGDVFISEREVRMAIEKEVGPLLPADRSLEAGVGPASVYRLEGARGRIGFISAMSAPFCSTCNRLRLTANGLLRSCLFEGGEVNVRNILRATTPGTTQRTALATAMSDCVRLKPEVHSHHGNEQMSRIGG